MTDVLLLSADSTVRHQLGLTYDWCLAPVSRQHCQTPNLTDIWLMSCSCQQTALSDPHSHCHMTDVLFLSAGSTVRPTLCHMTDVLFLSAGSTVRPTLCHMTHILLLSADSTVRPTLWLSHDWRLVPVSRQHCQTLTLTVTWLTSCSCQQTALSDPHSDCHMTDVLFLSADSTVRPTLWLSHDWRLLPVSRQHCQTPTLTVIWLMYCCCQQTALSDSHYNLYTLSPLTAPLPTTCPLIFPQNYSLKTFVIIPPQRYECHLFIYAVKRTVVPVHPMYPCEGAEAQLHTFLKSTWKKMCSLSRFGCLKLISHAHRIGDLLGTRGGLDDLRNRTSCFCGGNLNTISRLSNPQHSHCTNWALSASFILRTLLLISANYGRLASKRLWIPLNKKWLSPRVGLVALEMNMICPCLESKTHSPVISLLTFWHRSFTFKF